MISWYKYPCVYSLQADDQTQRATKPTGIFQVAAWPQLDPQNPQATSQSDTGSFRRLRHFEHRKNMVCATFDTLIRGGQALHERKQHRLWFWPFKRPIVATRTGCEKWTSSSDLFTAAGRTELPIIMVPVPLKSARCCSWRRHQSAHRVME